MPFELITDSLEDVKKSPVKSNKATVTISKLFGTVYFSKPTVELMGISEGSFVDCYIEREKNQIGFKVVTEKSDHTATVVTQKAPKGDNLIYKIKIKKFLENFKIDELKATIYDILKNDEEYVFFADLNKGEKKYNKKNKPSEAE